MSRPAKATHPWRRGFSPRRLAQQGSEMKTAPMFCAPNKTSEQHEKEREAADEMEATSDGQRMRSPDEATVKAADSYHRALNRQEREEIYVRITEKGRKKFRAAEMA